MMILLMQNKCFVTTKSIFPLVVLTLQQHCPTTRLVARNMRKWKVRLKKKAELKAISLGSLLRNKGGGCKKWKYKIFTRFSCRKLIVTKHARAINYYILGWFFRLGWCVSVREIVITV